MANKLLTLLLAATLCVGTGARAEEEVVSGGSSSWKDSEKKDDQKWGVADPVKSKDDKKWGVADPEKPASDQSIGEKAEKAAADPKDGAIRTTASTTPADKKEEMTPYLKFMSTVSNQDVNTLACKDGSKPYEVCRGEKKDKCHQSCSKGGGFVLHLEMGLKTYEHCDAKVTRVQEIPAYLTAWDAMMGTYDKNKDSSLSTEEKAVALSKDERRKVSEGYCRKLYPDLTSKGEQAKDASATGQEGQFLKSLFSVHFVSYKSCLAKLKGTDPLDILPPWEPEDEKSQQAYCRKLYPVTFKARWDLVKSEKATGPGEGQNEEGTTDRKPQDHYYHTEADLKKTKLKADAAAPAAEQKSEGDSAGSMPSGGWTTGWVRNHEEPYCGHGQVGTACENEIGTGYYKTGLTSKYFPFGCSGSRWYIKCTAEEDDEAALEDPGELSPTKELTKKSDDATADARKEEEARKKKEAEEKKEHVSGSSAK